MGKHAKLGLGTKAVDNRGYQEYIPGYLWEFELMPGPNQWEIFRIGFGGTGLGVLVVQSEHEANMLVEALNDQCGEYRYDVVPYGEGWVASAEQERLLSEWERDVMGFNNEFRSEDW